MDGTIVIGEGERDEAPMLFIGEKVGKPRNGDHAFPKVDIAVDPLEGTNLCATGSESAISVLAAAEEGGLLNAPDIYMNKLVVGPSNRGNVDINAPVETNLKAIARGLNRDVEDLVIIVLNRDRHNDLIAQIRKAGARIKLISDGDLSAGISAAMRGTGVHAVMGIGGAPEGVLTAAACRCLNGDMQAKLFPFKKGDDERMKRMGIKGGFDRVYTAEDLAPGKNIVFAATGVTNGNLLKGIRFFGGGYRANSVIMTYTAQNKTIKFIEDIALDPGTVIPVSMY
jgi:fructose-1,6-bisphosphatase class II